MDAYIVIMDREGIAASPTVKARLQNKFGRVYEFSEGSFLVAADDLTANIAQVAGMKGDDQIEGATGAVFRINGYAGYTDRALWEWLDKVEG